MGIDMSDMQMMPIQQTFLTVQIPILVHKPKKIVKGQIQIFEENIKRSSLSLEQSEIVLSEQWN